MRFADSFLDEIRARLPVSAVVGRRVQLKKRGREFVGLSPFNKEKTPSFTVNDQKGFYHCFSSGNHGDIFRFVMETEGLSFPEAVERLAGEAGVPMPAPDPQYEKQEEKRLGLLDALDIAALLFEKQLHSGAGREALAYARQRGLSDRTIEEFRIGYAPSSRDFLKTALIARDFTEPQLIEAGLLIKPDDGRPSYDRFRNRLIIPILDAKSRVIAFGARTMEEGGQPKYLNSPETPLFDKGSGVFNFARARGPAHDKSQLIVTEGYMDVIGLHQAGFRHAVATLGTAFTERQMQLLWQLAPEPVVCFDGDRAGEAAAARAVDRMLPHLREGQSFRFAFLPEGEDPDSLVKNQGPAAFDRVLAAAKPLIEVLWLREVSVQELDTPERRAAFEARLEKLMGEIRNPRVREHYTREIRSRLATLWQQSAPQAKTRSAYRGGPDKRRFGARDGRRGADTSSALPGRRLRDLPTSPRGFAITLLLGLMHHPFLLDRFAEEIAALDFGNAAFARLLHAITDAILEHPGISGRELEETLAGNGDAARFMELAGNSAFARISFLKPEAPAGEVEDQFRDLLYRWRALPSLRRELLELAENLAEATDAEFEQFAILQSQIANDGVEEAHEDAGDREAQQRFRDTIERIKRERIGVRRGTRPQSRA